MTGFDRLPEGTNRVYDSSQPDQPSRTESKKRTGKSGGRKVTEGGAKPSWSQRIANLFRREKKPLTGQALTGQALIARIHQLKNERTAIISTIRGNNVSIQQAEESDYSKLHPKVVAAFNQKLTELRATGTNLSAREAEIAPELEKLEDIAEKEAIAKLPPVEKKIAEKFRELKKAQSALLKEKKDNRGELSPEKTKEFEKITDMINKIIKLNGAKKEAVELKRQIQDTIDYNSNYYSYPNSSGLISRTDLQANLTLYEKNIQKQEQELLQLLDPPPQQ